MLYQFADCVIDTQQQQFYRGGQLLEIEPKPLQVLLYLLEHHGELVTHQQLFEHCWPGVIVTDGALLRCLSRIRRVIGQGRTNQPIETVYRKGYRFVGEVTQRASDDIPTSEAEESDLASTSMASSSPASATVERASADEFTPPELATTDRPTGSALPATMTSPTMVTAERRQITVFSCRWLAAAVDTDNEHDVEALYERGQQMRERCEALITPLGGRLMYTTQGELVFYFGYPHAFEDSAQRAVLAGLLLIEQSQQVPANAFDKQNLPLQIGVHTGPVVVESMTNDDTPGPLSVGPTQAIATQLSKQAPAQQVVVSETTAGLINGKFDCQLMTTETRPPAPSDRAIKSRHPLARAPFVGRDWELALLIERWTEARNGHGQVVWLSGEPGIGKSRLVQQLNDRLGEKPHRYWECQCSAYHQHTALFPLLELLRQLLGQPQIGVPDQLTDNGQRLEALAAHLQLDDTAVLLLAGLLSLTLPAERYPALTLDAQEQRQQSLHLLLSILLSEAQSQPLLLVIEDLHWADPSTLEFVQLLIHQVPGTALLLMLTARPDFTTSWNQQAAVTPLRLDRLNPQQSERLLRQLTEDGTLPANLVANLVAKTDGVPLFIEELTRMLMESLQLHADEHDFRHRRSMCSNTR